MNTKQSEEAIKYELLNDLDTLYTYLRHSICFSKRGYMTLEMVKAIHKKANSYLALDT